MISAVNINGQSFCVDLDSPNDISIPINFFGPQLNYFNVPKATANPYNNGYIVGNTKEGGGCNFDIISFIPHCSTTHTECVGHIVDENIFINKINLNKLKTALLVSIEPEIGIEKSELKPKHYSELDRIISGTLIKNKIKDYSNSAEVLVIRTMPNFSKKSIMKYNEDNIPPYFTISAIKQIIEAGFKHICIDLPSLDRAIDGGELICHHLFWGIPQKKHNILDSEPSQNTITELVFVPDNIIDGIYLINLQVSNLSLDAAPSRPVLFPIIS